MICRKFFISLILLALTIIPAYSEQSGGIEYHDYLFDYSKLDEGALRVEADGLFKQALSETNTKERDNLLHLAMKNYYILNKLFPNDVYVLNQRALIYDIQDRNILAKSYFARSMNIDKDNPDTNYLVGDYFYKRKDFKRALRYFSMAYQNGYSDYEISFKLAVVYEKLGDLCNAKRFYEEAYSHDNSKTFLLEKIDSIPEENEEYHGSIRS